MTERLTLNGETQPVPDDADSIQADGLQIATVTVDGNNASNIVWERETGVTRSFSLSNASLVAFAQTGQTATATYRLDPDGDGEEEITRAGSLPNLISNFDWTLPNEADFGDDYEVRATSVTGTLSSGTLGSWLALSSTREWSLSSSGSIENASISVEIRRSSDNVVVAGPAVIGFRTEPGI